jgi:hypothetical protein
MEILKLAEKVEKIRKGVPFRVIQEREVKPLKKFSHLKITKKNLIYGRSVNYENQSSVQEKRENGMKHRKSHLRKVMDLVYEDERNKSLKFCFAPSKLKNHRSKSKWFLDGKEVDYSEIEEYLGSSDKKRDRPDPEYYTLRLETVKDVKIKED